MSARLSHDRARMENGFTIFSDDEYAYKWESHHMVDV